MASASEVESTSRAVVAEFCSDEIMFTALDVSNEVKARLSGVRHREVAPIVRRLFEDDAMDDDYARSSINVHIDGGKTVEAYLYHPEGRDTAEYGQRQRAQRAAAPGPGSAPRTAPAVTRPTPTAPTRPTPAAAVAAASAVSAPAKPTQALSYSGTRTLSLQIAADGTLALPRAALERAGILGDEIALDTAGFGSGLVLTEADGDEDEDEEPLELLEYDSGDVLRIPAAYLSAFGAGARLEAHLERGEVRIEGA